jgi:hypothetical protein
MGWGTPVLSSLFLHLHIFFLHIFTSHCIGRSNIKELDDIFWWAKVQFSLYFFWESSILA